MPVITRDWTFASSDQGWQTNSGWTNAEGSPDAGCLAATGPDNNQVHGARFRYGVVETFGDPSRFSLHWQTLGIPTDQYVTAVRLSFRWRTNGTLLVSGDPDGVAHDYRVIGSVICPGLSAAADIVGNTYGTLNVVDETLSNVSAPTAWAEVSGETSVCLSYKTGGTGTDNAFGLEIRIFAADAGETSQRGLIDTVHLEIEYSATPCVPDEQPGACEERDIVLVLDCSGSMADPFGDTTRYNAARSALTAITEVVDTSGCRLGIVVFHQDSGEFGWSDNRILTPYITGDFGAVRNAIASEIPLPRGGTSTRSGLTVASGIGGAGYLNGYVRPTARGVIILISDGNWNVGGDPIPIAEQIVAERPDWLLYVVDINEGEPNSSNVEIGEIGAGWFSATNPSELLAALQAAADPCGSPPPCTMTISPGSVTLVRGATQQFTASAPATFSVIEAGGGTIDSGGLYTAPWDPGVYTVRATDIEDAGCFDDATVTVAPECTIEVTPVSVTLLTGAAQDFMASDPAVWSATGGAVDATGHYIAPDVAGVYFVTATHVDFPECSATATVTVTAPGPSAPPGVNFPEGAMQRRFTYYADGPGGSILRDGHSNLWVWWARIGLRASTNAGFTVWLPNVDDNLGLYLENPQPGPGVVDSAATAVTGTGTDFQAINAGDLLLITSGPARGQANRIASVTDTENLTLQEAFSVDVAGAEYKLLQRIAQVSAGQADTPVNIETGVALEPGDSVLHLFWNNDGATAAALNCILDAFETPNIDWYDVGDDTVNADGGGAALAALLLETGDFLLLEDGSLMLLEG